MQQVQSLIILNDDYKKILSWLRNGYLLNAKDAQLIQQLKDELMKAKQVSRDIIPGDVVRLHSTVTVMEMDKQQPYTFTIVPPGQTSIPEKRVSLLAPIATAIFGYKKGDCIEWKVPAGQKKFLIQDVVNID
jgi:regulator of nucleoside diphosphate kinase